MMMGRPGAVLVLLAFLAAATGCEGSALTGSSADSSEADTADAGADADANADATDPDASADAADADATDVDPDASSPDATDADADADAADGDDADANDADATDATDADADANDADATDTDATDPDVTDATDPDVTDATDPDATDATDPDVTDATDPDATDPDVGPSHPSVTVGAPDRILLIGTVLTPDVAFVGEVLVVGALIVCAEPGNACSASPDAVGATVIDSDGGVIAPGLIDTHNHILFDIFDDSDWLPAEVYTNHTQWPNEDRYKAMLDMKQCLEDASQGKPTWCPLTYDGAGSLKCEMDKWGELKGMVAGTTSIVGLPGTSSACFGSLSRSIDVIHNDLDADHIQTSALFPPSKSSADAVCGNFETLKTDAYLIHVGEGTDAKALAEFAKLRTLTTVPDCLLAAETVITHGTAFGDAEFAVMADHEVKLAWSPASNVALYGATTDIPAALDAGVLVTLAPDWSMGGSQNLMDELRFADAWDDVWFGDTLSARDLVLMVTQNAAFALALDDRIGAVAPGLLADLVVVAGASDPYRALIAARPASVVLTMVGGRILYGDAALLPAAAPGPACEAISVCEVPKFLCVAESTTASKLDQTYAQIHDALQAALEDLDVVSEFDGFDFAPLAPLVRCD